MTSLSKAESLLINDFNMGFNIEDDIVIKKNSNKEISFNDEEEDLDYLENLENINDEFLNRNMKIVAQ